MYVKKLIVICCSIMFPLLSLASQPRGKYYGNCQRKICKKQQYAGPDQSFRKKLGSRECAMAKKLASIQKATSAEASSMSLYSGLPLVEMPYAQEHREASCHFYRSGPAHPILAVILMSLLFVAPHVYAAQQEQTQEAGFEQAFTLAERIRIAQSARSYDGTVFHCDGCFQPVAGYMDTLADSYHTFESNHETAARYAIPGIIVGLKALYGAIIGGLETESLVGAGVGLGIGAGKGVIDQAKGAVAAELLGGVIDPVVQYGIEHIAPQLMKYDCTLKQESAERLASWIAAGWFLNSCEFKHFAKYMRAADFKALRAGARLKDLANTKLTFSEFTYMPFKLVLSGTPVEVNEILIHKSLMEFHDIPVSGNAFQQVVANAGQYMSSGTPTTGVPGNAFQQVIANPGQYMSADIPTGGVPGNAFQQLIEIAGLYQQSHIPTSTYAGNGYSGNAFQQAIANAGLYMQTNGQSNNPTSNFGGNGYAGNAFQQFTQSPGSHFSGNNPSSGVPGNAFSQMSNSASQYFGGSGSSKHW